MLAQWRRLHRHAPSIHLQLRCISDLRPFQAGDLVLLREKLNRSAPPILTRPLQAGKQVESHKGVIKHGDIIGKRVRDVVSTAVTRKNAASDKIPTEYRLHEVKLEEYVRLSKRLVTPVYPSDARLIVELLDLHPSSYGEGDETGDAKLEILEAGTGHGALTLYLSRAIHGANQHYTKSSTTESLEDQKDNRRAIIHTLDVSEKYSLHARKVVEGFRHGLYSPNIEFHTADVSTWTKSQLVSRSNEPFLSHAILDLPNADLQLETVAKALRVDGTLVVFNPSITQITQCATRIREKGIPLELERVVELPTNGEAGGREWSVRAVRPRSTIKAEAQSRDPDVFEDAADDLVIVDGQDRSADKSEGKVSASQAHKEEGWQMVCRPKVGDRIIGGGFVGVWKKQRESSP